MGRADDDGFVAEVRRPGGGPGFLNGRGGGGIFD